MKKNIFLWSLYDFANSIIMIVFLFYFSQWLVVDSGKPDWWFNVALIIPSVLFIITAPVIGYRIDTTGRKLFGLRVTTVVSVLGFLATALITLIAPDKVFLAVVLYIISLYFYLVCFTFYTPMINDLANDSNRSFISGLGQASNSFGQVMGLLMALPFATGAIYLFGAEGRAQTLLPSVVFFGLLAAPMLIWYKENTTGDPGPLQIKESYKKLFSIAKNVFSVRNLAFLLISYFLFSDALLTFSNNFPIFLEKVHAATDTTKTFLSASILVLAIFGALIFGKIADKKGTARTLTWILVAWTILFPILAFAPSFTVVIIVCLIAGTLFGPVWAISRAMIAEYSPKNLTASTFSFYTVAERFATLLGPLVWSLALSFTSGSGTKAYSYAILSMALLILLSLFFMFKVERRPPPANLHSALR